jgi:hypothetical protein
MLEVIGFIILLLTVSEWLFGKLAQWPEASFRLITLVVGLFLAVGMTVGGINLLMEPEADSGMGWLFFLWAGLGVWLVVKAVKG